MALGTPRFTYAPVSSSVGHGEARLHGYAMESCYEAAPR